MVYKFRAQGRGVGANKQMSQILEIKVYEGLESRAHQTSQIKR